MLASLDRRLQGSTANLTARFMGNVVLVFRCVARSLPRLA